MNRHSFFGQASWSLGARIMATGFTLATVILLARSLSPATFAFVASVQVALKTIVAVNGFGLERQLQVFRARDPQHPDLQSVFVRRLRNSYASALFWLACTSALWLVTGSALWLAVAPAAIWLAAEQTTMTWNGISIVDGKSQHLVASYLFRLGPPVPALLLAMHLDWNVILTWTTALSAGSVIAYLNGWRNQERWARVLLPHRRLVTATIDRDLAFWWSKVGEQFKDLDVAAVTMISNHAGGLYALPARLIRPLNIVTTAVGAVAFPRLVRMQRITRRQLYLGVLLGALPVVVMAAALAALASFVPEVVGKDYAAAVAPLRVHCLVGALTGVSALLIIMLQARTTEANRFAGRSALWAAVAQVALATAGATVDGALGASVGAAVAQATLVVVLFVRADRQTQLESSKPTHLPGALRQ